jgi:hypothetical protein
VPSALQALAGAFGDELLVAENSLVSVMRAHWVDQADREFDRIVDLAALAALYGLAPRPDEDVEEFREHLKRYVRTFLEGTVTVEGVLRISAEALGLRLDEDAGLDPWWRRRGAASGGEVVVSERRGADAAPLLGLAGASARGAPRLRAELHGTVALGAGVDLRSGSLLRLRIDGGSVHEIDLAASAADPAAVTLDELMAAIVASAGPGTARAQDGHLVVSSPTAGAAGTVELLDTPDDAAQRVLGLLPRTSWGASATAARVVGARDLSGGVDLSHERYLRVAVDGVALAEVDCAGADPAHTTLAEVRAAIDAAFAQPVAFDEDARLALVSPTSGASSSVAVQRAAAQDAAERVLGPSPRFAVGRDARPGRLVGRPDLSAGVDLRGRSTLRVAADGAAPVEVDCTGADPARTLPGEIAAAVNAAVGAPVASHDGRVVSLSSPTVGPTGSIAVVDGPADAAEPILGLPPRSARGAEPAPARILGTADLGAGVDVSSRFLLELRVDEAPPASADLRSAAADPAHASAAEVAAAINAAAGAPIASAAAGRIALESLTTGAGSSLSVEVPQRVTRERFVTYATVADEAARTLLGTVAAETRGQGAEPARLVGEPDLSRGVDLRDAHHLRLSVDGRPAVEIDCAGEQPRSTTLDELVARIAAALAGVVPEGARVARHDGAHLVLVSPTAGAGSRLELEPPRAEDALDRLLGIAPTVAFGAPATRVTLVGTVDLAAGIELPADAAIRLAVDGAPAVEVPLTGAGPESRTLPDLVVAVNTALDAVVAAQDGRHLLIVSATRGSGSRIELEPPAGTDVTEAVLGFPAPRAYRGEDAAPARIAGARTLPSALDLSVARYLLVALDAGPAVDVDCAARAADAGAASPAEVVDALDAALGAGVAGVDDGRLTLTSPTVGPESRVALERRPGSDARAALFGNAPPVAGGSPALPATIVGTPSLLLPVDLSRRGVLRLAVDGGPPVDVDVAGPVPGKTVLADVVAALESALPGVGSATPDDRLRLASPTAGVESTLAVLPLRRLSAVEYPARELTSPAALVAHGDRVGVTNASVAGAAAAEFVVRARSGVAGPGVVDLARGWYVRALVPLADAEELRLRRQSEGGLAAEIRPPSGPPRRVVGGRLLAGPLGPQAWVPFAGSWRLAGNRWHPELQLNDPLEPGLVRLRARDGDPAGREIAVAVAEATADASAPAVPAAAARIVARLRRDGPGYRLEANGGTVLARLLPGRLVRLDRLDGRVVVVEGRLEDEDPPLLVGRDLHAAYDVTVERGATTERYERVTIGTLAGRPDALDRRVVAAPSTLVAAEELDGSAALELPAGPSQWLFLDCLASRFDETLFDGGRFADGVCAERGLFDVSRFARTPPEPVVAVFAPAGALTPSAEVELGWRTHEPGAFTVDLPADLPARFGGHFDSARFALSSAAPELFEGAVFEPPAHSRFLARLLDEGSKLVGARPVEIVPLGWEAVPVPFRKPRPLTLGTPTQTARIYLSEPGVPGFVEVAAREEGAWGNQIAIVARKSGRAQFDVEIAFEAGRFESARAIVRGAAPSGARQELLRPGPVGVLQAKAAGVRAEITRDRASDGRPQTDD